MIRWDDDSGELDDGVFRQDGPMVVGIADDDRFLAGRAGRRSGVDRPWKVHIYVPGDSRCDARSRPGCDDGDSRRHHAVIAVEIPLEDVLLPAVSGQLPILLFLILFAVANQLGRHRVFVGDQVDRGRWR